MLFLIQHQRMEFFQFFGGDLDHATIISHQSVDFCFHISCLSVHTGGNALRFQGSKPFAGRLVTSLQFIKSLRQIAVSPNRTRIFPEVIPGRKAVPSNSPTACRKSLYRSALNGKADEDTQVGDPQRHSPSYRHWQY